MRTYLTVALLFCMATGYSQTFNITLSPQHQKKISGIESGHKRMKKYYKYFKKDSSQHFRKINRKEKKAWDSTMRALRKQERLQRKLGEKYPALYAHSLDSINEQLKTYNAILNDTTQSDSVRVIAREKVKDILVTRVKMDPNFSAIESQYANLPDSVSWEDLSRRVPLADSLRTVFKDPKELMDFSAALAERQLLSRVDLKSIAGASEQMNEINGMTETYKGKYDIHQNKDSLLSAGKDKMAEKALDYFSQHPAKLEAASQKASKLLSKYSAFSNSNDLSDATKRTSMEGKTLFEKLVFGGTFNVVSTGPVSIDLSPQLGYKFSTKFFIGVGMRYRATFSDSIKSSYYISPKNTAIKLFGSYDLWKQFFGYVEAELTGASRIPEQYDSRRWYRNYFVGVGRKFLVHPKLYVTTTALYNLNSQEQNPVHPQRFQVRVGFQLSELATRKKAINYDPNR